jgi:SAM-dependent methyltransferase
MKGSAEDAQVRWLERWGIEQARLVRERRVAEERRISRRLARISARSRLARDRRALRLEAALARLADRAFDYGLDTAGDSREPEHAHRDRVPYVASPWHVLPRALHVVGVSEADTFVDFGCGKGRIVHQAARRPFRRVIGLEVSPALADVARANLAARRCQHRSGSVEIVVSDAAGYEVPDDVTIGYLFAPFEGETFDALLRSVIASIDRNPRPVRLIYVFPGLGARVLATGRFRLAKELRGGLRDMRARRAAIFESC